jgi:hypothetical protein
MTTRRSQEIPINLGPTKPETVMSSPEAPADGVYYLSASLTFGMGSGDEVACQFFPDPTEGSTQNIGPVSNSTFETMTLNGAVSLSAGQDVTIICINGNSSGNNTLTVKLAQGNLNAVLVSKSSGAVSSSAVRAQKSTPSLKIMKP